MQSDPEIVNGASSPDPWQAWLAWALLHNERSPWSGDVTQWIRAWGEAVGQVGLFNINYAGSSDPQAERRITGRYSYGRQLGRLMDVLVPFLEKHEAEFRNDDGGRALDDFLEMAREIAAVKKTTVDDLLDHAWKWRKDADFRAKLQALRQGLDKLEKNAR
ncbi:hypothetical protein [Cupriavidus plantarum]|uniref:Uncharacterized protein n=1 Tax=Cupriavidus plantarum TaxID=942865 RepID=A0A316EPG1_9BURK|nr:hypothetical protein [Cupriavidus plantarum]PWK33740.1 hypothetical protein C7419_10359 [Cupriavidus plantarum]RLK33590.1 hypothetical protein C7417_4239 [Cupriavidus plantarum]